MTDQLGRTIDYMRVSITDRCNLRCRYCMPNGIQPVSHSDLLSYEEMLRLCEIAASLGIVKFKVTGGEPLVRKGCVDFAARLKELPGVEQVTLTTNGLLLEEHLDGLCAAGIDGINISLDTLDPGAYRRLTGYEGEAPHRLREVLRLCVDRGLRTKVNAVLLTRTFRGIADLAGLAGELPVDVRFIELMPIGEGAAMSGAPVGAALARLRQEWPDLQPTGEIRGNGPARYYGSDALQGRIGFIDAVSRKFCDSCNRVRLTAVGALKPCLCYDQGIDLRDLLLEGADDRQLRQAMEAAIYAKPGSHCFSRRTAITERKAMHQIGG